MTFRLQIQRMKNQGNVRIKFNLKKLLDPNIAEIFRATTGGKFVPLLALDNQDTDIDASINSFNTAVTETANNILGKNRPAKEPWVTAKKKHGQITNAENRSKRRIPLKAKNFTEKLISKLKKA